MNIKQDRIIINAKRNWVTTLAMILTAALFVLDLFVENAVVLGISYAILKKISIVLTIIKMAIDKFLQPNYSEEDMLQFANEAKIGGENMRVVNSVHFPTEIDEQRLYEWESTKRTA